ncbi:Cytochrome P450 family protein [Quillaja saponaria]|uniref:Cytochrome P450 family protein n=1 Tax=Quillaja saponaria TaxID=32244 RepID=A0AAD7VGB9_QUISA|nr:Cytochrome P450 family protein [Quillaja saponaria]
MVHSLFRQRKFELLVEETIHNKVDSCLIPVLNFASEQARELDLKDVMERVTFDNICSMVLGFDPKCLSTEFPKVAYEKAFNELEKTLHIATHPSVATKILEEIKCKFAPKEGEWRVLSTRDVGKLVYLHAAIFESFRLFPPVRYLHVCTINSDILPSGYRINPKTKVFHSLYAMGRTQEIWGEDYLEFKPERWISENGGIIHIPSYKFIAFGAGPRSCLGMDMSITAMKMVASAIIWNYHIQMVEGHHVSPSSSVILHMKHGLKVKITKRCI